MEELKTDLWFRIVKVIYQRICGYLSWILYHIKKAVKLFYDSVS